MNNIKPWIFIILCLSGLIVENYTRKNPISTCNSFCDTQKSKMLQMSSGICLCDDEEGNRAADSYHNKLGRNKISRPGSQR